uniref:(northern house mosquito) hypothetical protein n=1 Tax=Culex pipiens TaxID=7175 RepID=A0A8D8B049_CULPI
MGKNISFRKNISSQQQHPFSKLLTIQQTTKFFQSSQLQDVSELMRLLKFVSKNRINSRQSEINFQGIKLFSSHHNSTVRKSLSRNAHLFAFLSKIFRRGHPQADHHLCSIQTLVSLPAR